MITISFLEQYDLSEHSIRLLRGTVGLYFIYLETIDIQYPFGRSRLIYIGLSESKQNSVGNRLRDHLSGQSGNLAISNYAKRHALKFTFLSFDVLKILGTNDLYELESFFLKTFLTKFGSFPICNNQSGIFVSAPLVHADDVTVSWDSFAAVEG